MVKVIRLGVENYSVVLHGFARFRVNGHGDRRAVHARARSSAIAEDHERDAELDALGAELREATRKVLGLMPNLPKETAGILDNVRESGTLADLIASNLTLDQASVADKQRILETLDPKARVRAVAAIVNRQIEVLRVKREISVMVADEGKNQRELILRQQMKNIREELGEGAEDDEVEELRERIRLAQLSEEAQKVAKKQLGRLSSMQPQSAEYNVIADLPRVARRPAVVQDDRRTSSTPSDVRRCLDEDHFGLEKVKKRIVEYIAVRKLRADKKGPILCFIGPPGVGKTSLGKSIARSMGRRYHRIALGGVRDEAEVRGHRRTYVGALPGRIIQALKKAGTKNPVLVLDEVDKLGVDAMGDPAAALLEVLDPAQNDTFSRPLHRHRPSTFSQVTFLATANNRRHHPRRALGPAGGHRGPWLHAQREALHRPRVPGAQAARGPRADRRAARVGSTTGSTRSSRATRARRAFATWSARSAPCAGRLPCAWPKGRTSTRWAMRRTSRRSSGRRGSSRIWPSGRATRASLLVLRGPPRGATSCSSRRARCRARGRWSSRAT